MDQETILSFLLIVIIVALFILMLKIDEKNRKINFLLDQNKYFEEKLEEALAENKALKLRIKYPILVESLTNLLNQKVNKDQQDYINEVSIWVAEIFSNASYDSSNYKLLRSFVEKELRSRLFTVFYKADLIYLTEKWLINQLENVVHKLLHSYQDIVNDFIKDATDSQEEIDQEEVNEEEIDEEEIDQEEISKPEDIAKLIIDTGIINDSFDKILYELVDFVCEMDLEHLLMLGKQKIKN